MSDKVETIFFDAGETLIHVRKPLYVLYTGIINTDRKTDFDTLQVKEAMKAQLDETGMVKDGHFRYSDGWFSQYIKGMLGRLECPEPWNGIRDGLFQLFDSPDTFQVFPDARACIDVLRSRGYKMAVVSNWGYRLPRLLDRLGLGPAFETVVASADVEVEKPDPHIFRIALERTGADPKTTIHIGDNEEADVEGAKAAGIRGILIDREDSETLKTYQIASLEEIPRIAEDG